MANVEVSANWVRRPAHPPIGSVILTQQHGLFNFNRVRCCILCCANRRNVINLLVRFFNTHTELYLVAQPCVCVSLMCLRVLHRITLQSRTHTTKRQTNYCRNTNVVCARTIISPHMLITFFLLALMSWLMFNTLLRVCVQRAITHTCSRVCEECV